MSKLSQELRAIARDKAARANYARASYCAGRAGCEELQKIQDKPQDYREWKAADEIERLENTLHRGVDYGTTRRGL